MSSGARDFAAGKHRAQKRKYSEVPYVVHVDTVAQLLQTHGIADGRVLAAASLHDTIEETETSIQELTRLSGDEAPSSLTG
jgi:(p)ppGpp synthase/HD superfamily hydrolase